MQPFSIALLIAQGVIFLIWTVLVFRWLFALRADAVADSGNALPGVGATIQAFRGGLLDKRYARERLWLGIATIALLGSSLLHFLL